jgi:hypothetical protein
MLALTLTLLLHTDAGAATKSAQIELEQAEAQSAVDAKYGNKKPGELTASETRAKVRDQAAADRQVLEKNGLTPKEWARDSLKRSRAEFAEEKVALKALELKKKADAEAAAKPVAAVHEIQIQRGISEANPVILEEAAGAAPIVENGLPPEVLADQTAAREAEGSAPKSKPDSAKRKKKSNKKHVTSNE